MLEIAQAVEICKWTGYLCVGCKTTVSFTTRHFGSDLSSPAGKHTTGEQPLGAQLICEWAAKRGNFRPGARRGPEANAGVVIAQRLAQMAQQSAAGPAAATVRTVMRASAALTPPTAGACASGASSGPVPKNPFKLPDDVTAKSAVVFSAALIYFLSREMPATSGIYLKLEPGDAKRRLTTLDELCAAARTLLTAMAGSGMLHHSLTLGKLTAALQAEELTEKRADALLNCFAATMDGSNESSTAFARSVVW